MEYSRRNKSSGVTTSRWFFRIGVVVLVLLIVAYIRVYIKNYEVEQEIKRLQTVSEQWNDKKFQTLELLNYVRSPDFVEEKARTELNLVKEGEHITVVPGSSAVPSSRHDDTSVVESDHASNFVLWWRYFFGDKQ